MNIIEGKFQDKLIDVLKNGTLTQRKDTMSKVPLCLAYSVPVLSEQHIPESINKN